MNKYPLWRLVISSLGRLDLIYLIMQMTFLILPHSIFCRYVCISDLKGFFIIHLALICIAKGSLHPEEMQNSENRSVDGGCVD